MAIFGFKKEKKEEKAAKPAKVNTVAAPSRPANPHVANFSTDVIIRPRVTEKSGIQSQGGTYTFEVAANANKNTVAQAISLIYKVRPIRVNMSRLPAKNVFHRGRWGKSPGVRKAIVTLKKGDKIDFV